jgi:hypothetical protein
MLFLFLLIALLGGCGLIIGNALLVRLDPGQCFDRVGDRALVSAWLGVLVLANLFLTIALFRPLSPSFVVPATLLLLIISLWPRQNRYALNSLFRLPATGILGLAALALGAAAYCSQVIVWYDTGLYHIQAINWFSEFGLVPGVALIHSRLGYVSAWFTLPALFNHGVLQGRIASLPGALCLFLLLCHGLVAFLRLVRRRGRFQDLFIFSASLLVVAVALLWGMPNSPSPDFPIAALVIVVSWAILAISRQDDRYQLDRSAAVAIVPLILAAGAASIKLSALPLVMVAGCFYLLSGKASSRKAVAAAGLAMLALAPSAAAGIVASGCAFYPISLLCVDLPWSLGAEFADAEALLIRDWNRWGMLTPDHATSWNWILPWLRAETTCTALFFLSLTATVSLPWSSAGNVLKQYRAAYLAALGALGIAFMFYSAPTWRMGLGYLVVLPALALAEWIHSRPSILQHFGRITGRNFGLIGTAVAVVLALHIHIVPRPSYRLLDTEMAQQLVTGDDPHFNPWVPPRIWNLGYDDRTTGQTMIVENPIIQDLVEDVIYYHPEDLDRSDLCWDAPLPCSPYKLEGIRSGPRGGFEKVRTN